MPDMPDLDVTRREMLAVGVASTLLAVAPPALARAAAAPGSESAQAEPSYLLATLGVRALLAGLAVAYCDRPRSVGRCRGRGAPTRGYIRHCLGFRRQRAGWTVVVRRRVGLNFGLVNRSVSLATQERRLYK